VAAVFWAGATVLASGGAFARNRKDRLPGPASGG
jgi:hypothetical protein